MRIRTKKLTKTTYIYFWVLITVNIEQWRLCYNVVWTVELLCCVFDSWVTVDNVYSSTLQSARDISEVETLAIISQPEESIATLYCLYQSSLNVTLKIDIIISGNKSGNEHFSCHGHFMFYYKRAYCTQPCWTFFQLDITKVFRCWINKKLSYISQNLLRKNNHILGETFYRNTIL